MKKICLIFEQIESIFNYAKKNIKIFSTCGDKKTIDFIDKQFNPYAFKVSSGMLEHFPYWGIYVKKRELIISTGMSDLKEIEMLVNFLKKRMLSKTVLMHCVSLYPTPLKK